MAPPRLTLVSSSHKSDQTPPPEASAEDADTRADVPGSAAVKALPALTASDRNERMRMLEALLFAASEPLDEAKLAGYLPGAGADAVELLDELKGYYRGRGINLVRIAGKWSFRTAEDLSYLLEKHATEERRLSRAALETLAIVAYHQPVTRAEIEEIRGVSTSAGTLDILMETGWVRPRGRRRAPGKPITYGTTEVFLTHFGFDSVKDLPGLAELKGAGLLDGNLPPGFTMPEPSDVAALMSDELPLEAGEDEDVQSEMDLDLPEEDEADKAGPKDE
jgi:segregation and condensation protein B